MSLWSRVQRRIGDLAGDLILDEYRDQLDQAQRLLASGNALDAIALLEALLAAKADHGQAWILLGEARLAAQQPDAAVEAFERALQLRPGDPAALVGHGLGLVDLARYEPAITALARAVADAAGDRGVLADAYRGLGIAWRRRGDNDKAIRELRKAVAEDGGDAFARAALGEALVADGRALDEAARHLERAASAQPPSPLAPYALGRLALLENGGDPRQIALAAERFATARALAEQDTTPLGAQIRLDILIAQGDAALAARDAHRAHAHYLEALQTDPRRAELHAKIAATHRSIGNLDAALLSFERALALGAGLATLRAAIDTAIAAGDPERQARWASDLLIEDPTDRRAIVARAASTPEPAAARALFELAAARDDADAHVGLARLALDADPASAASHALAALRVAPHHAAARQTLTAARAVQHGQPGPDIAELATYLQRLVGQRRELGHLVGDIARAAANLDQPLLVTVMGEFSSGKSSFVNAFIGADVAPTGITPTTATINVVRYGRERGGRILRGDDGRGAPSVSSAADRQRGVGDDTARELPWDELMAQLRALAPDDARHIDRVEILVPLPQLEKINIVDTPGLNSIQPEHEATARAFIARADAIVWVFTAAQGGKASEKRALASIRDEGKRVLGVLNKADQLSADESAEVLQFIAGELGDLVEAIVPVSARKALAWKKAERRTDADGNWPALDAALEQRFFQQARQLKRDGCARALRAVVATARTALDAQLRHAAEAAAAARAARDQLRAATRSFTDAAVVAERKALSDATTTLYRRAAREVLDLVRPRRLPFSSHTATNADRDYLIALLSSGFETAIEAGRRRVADDLATRAALVNDAARTLAGALDVDVVGDLQRAADDRIGLALSRVFDRARAFLRGYLEGGYVEAFFRNDVPRLDLAEDAVYHALVRNAPDLDREIAEPLERAATDALTALADRLAHWSDVVDVHAFDLEVGFGRALELAEARL